MRKKGFTMVELMVSIAIIAVVMVFLVRLLIDIKYDFTNELYNTANQINRSEIIKTIQEDWLGKELYTIDNTNNNIILKTADGENQQTATISFEEDDNNQYIKYNSTSNKESKWKIEKNNKETYLQTNDIKVKVTKNTENLENINDTVIEIDIPIIIDKSTLRKNNDSRMDNIVLTFYIDSENSFSNNMILNQTT